MATTTSFKQQCPSCEAMVPIRDPGLIGRKIDCPKCKYRFVVEDPGTGVEEEPGAGLTGMVDNRQVAVGSYSFVCASATPADWSEQFLRRMGYEGATGVFVDIDGAMTGALLLHDEIRLETKQHWRSTALVPVERRGGCGIALTSGFAELDQIARAAYLRSPGGRSCVPGNRIQSVEPASKPAESLLF